MKIKIEKIKVIWRIWTLIQETKGRKLDGLVKENIVGAGNGVSLRHFSSVNLVTLLCVLYMSFFI